MVEITADAKEVVSRKADDRGRVRLGPEFADQDVEVAILDVEESDETPDDEAQTTN